MRWYVFDDLVVFLTEGVHGTPGECHASIQLGCVVGHRPEATLANAAAAGVADRVEVHTADMTASPFADGSFDVVTSALAIHNIPSPDGRYRAVDEAVRVLRPGGQVLIADSWPMARNYARHIGQGTRSRTRTRVLVRRPVARHHAAACR